MRMSGQTREQTTKNIFVRAISILLWMLSIALFIAWNVKYLLHNGPHLNGDRKVSYSPLRMPSVRTGADLPLANSKSTTVQLGSRFSVGTRRRYLVRIDLLDLFRASTSITLSETDHVSFVLPRSSSPLRAFPDSFLLSPLVAHSY